MVGACLLDEISEIMLITNGGTIVRTRSTEISVVGRNTQGVRLIRLTKDENLVQIERVCETVNDDNLDEDLTENDAEPSAGEEPSANQEPSADNNKD